MGKKVKQEEVKQEEAKQEEAKQEEAKQDETKQEESKQEEALPAKDEKPEEKPEEKPAPEKKEDEAEEEKQVKDDPAPDADHPDQDKDIALIKSMLDKYVGKPDHDEEEVKMAHEAYKCAIEMGEDESEAAKCAGYAMKMARHMAAKAAKQPAPQAEAASPLPESEKGKEEEAKQEESSKVLDLTAENAKLKKLIETRELADYVEDKCAKSGVERSVTKLFRETAEFKNRKEFDDKFEKFIKTYRESSSETGDLYGFVTNSEKSTEPTGSVSFADCITE